MVIKISPISSADKIFKWHFCYIDCGKMEKELFLEQFERARRVMLEGGLIFAQPTPLPEEKPVSILPCARVIIPLGGRMPFDYADGTAIRTAEFLPGNTVYAPPYGWSNPGWNMQQEFVSLVFQHDYLRFLYIDHDGTRELPAGPEPDIGKFIYHTAGAPSRTVSLLVGAMNSYAEHPGDSAFALQCLDLLLCESLEQLRRDQAVKTGKSRRLWLRIRDYMRENFHRPITRQIIAERFVLNPCYVSRLFMANGENFNAYLLTLRMNQALHLLENSPVSVKEIAYHTGFNSTGYFIKAFTARFGITPGAFRNSRDETVVDSL